MRSLLFSSSHNVGLGKDTPIRHRAILGTVCQEGLERVYVIDSSGQSGDEVLDVLQGDLWCGG